MAILSLLQELVPALVSHAYAAPVCPIVGLPCPTTISLTAFLGKVATGIAGSAFGIITAMLIFYSLKLTVSGQEESNVTEVRNAYLHVIYGAVIIAGASFLVALATLTPGVATPAPLINGILIPMRNFFFTMVTAALTINIGFQGARLITAQEESASGAARQGIVKGVLGLSAVLLAGAAVRAFGFDDITGLFLTADSSVISNELTGIGRFLITLLGALAMVCLVAAGFFLVVSTDEQLKDRSKKIVITTAVAILIVMASAIIISIFI